MSQTSLFRSGSYGSIRPTTGEAVRNEHYARTIPEAGTRRRQYYDLLTEAAGAGIRTRSGQVLHALTDEEAASILHHRTGESYWRRSSVNGRRNALMGRGREGRPWKDAPVVRAAGRRTCHVTGNRVNTWTINS